MSSSPVEPARAAVRPRIVGEAGTAPGLLEDRIAELLAVGNKAFVWIEAPERGGKTTALRHLAAVFAGDARLGLRDYGDVGRGPAEAIVTVLVRRPLPTAAPGAGLLLAPWSDDDCLEYLMARHPARVGDAFEKWRLAPSAHDLAEWPELCAAVLDALAGREDSPGVVEALDHVLSARFAPESLADLRVRALRRQTFRGDDHEASDLLVEQRLALRCLTVQHRLAARCLVDLVEAKKSRIWARPPRWEQGFLAELADLVRSDASRRARLEGLASDELHLRVELLTMLNAAFPGYRPARDSWHGIAGAHLPGIDLSGRKLSGLLEHTVLRGALLRGSDLMAAHARGVDFSGADMRGVVADGTDFRGADLSGAVLDDGLLRLAALSGCRLNGASLRGADLSVSNLAKSELQGCVLAGCRLERASLAGLDLRGADLRGAILNGAILAAARLDGLEIEDLEAEKADLRHADLTASRLPRARLRGANLFEAGLAAIEWEHADLRHADLSRATFHLGSARSGLVFSDLASEGTRTGFYTDEALEDAFLAPELVRKANLRFADLRGAKLDGVDFYLVDLRGALLDPNQLDWVRRCKAILDPRV